MSNPNVAFCPRLTRSGHGHPSRDRFPDLRLSAVLGLACRARSAWNSTVDGDDTGTA